MPHFRFRHITSKFASHASSSSKFIRFSQFIRHYLAKYNYCLERYPFLTQGISAAFLFGSGDVICQCIEQHQQHDDKDDLPLSNSSSSKRSSFTTDTTLNSTTDSTTTDISTTTTTTTTDTSTTLSIDFSRMFRMMLYGSLVFAPAAHLWYKYLDKRIIISKHNKFKQISKKVFMDEFVFTPVILIAFFSCMTSMEHYYEQLFPSIKKNENITTNSSSSSSHSMRKKSISDHQSDTTTATATTTTFHSQRSSSLTNSIWKRGEEDQFNEIVSQQPTNRIVNEQQEQQQQMNEQQEQQQQYSQVLFNNRDMTPLSSSSDLPQKIISKLKKDYLHTFLVDMIVWPPLQYL